MVNKNQRQPKPALLGKPTVQDVSMKNRLAKIHRSAALDVRDTIRGGRYLIAVFPIDEEGDLMPDVGIFLANVPWTLYPEIVGRFKDEMQQKLAARRNPEDDNKEPLEILDEVISQHTPPEDADDAEPIDPED